MKILFVCAGNTCRSPMAEAMMNAKLAAAGRTDITCASAGTHVWPGDTASRDTVQEMAARGLSVEGRAARQLSEAMGAEADLILTMTGGVAQAVLAQLPEEKAKVSTLCAFVGEAGDVEDPYGCGEEVYHETANQLDALLERLLAKLG